MEPYLKKSKPMPKLRQKVTLLKNVTLSNNLPIPPIKLNSTFDFYFLCFCYMEVKLLLIDPLDFSSAMESGSDNVCTFLLLK